MPAMTDIRRLDCVELPVQMAAPRLLLAATYLAFDHPLLDKRIQLSCAVDETMKNLFEQFGWQGHLPLDSVRTPPIATPSALQAL